MDGQPQIPSAEALLSHADWVRALARTLVDDPQRADDVAQEAWLGALETPPRDARNLRGWLSQVVRNAARQGRRSQDRRALWERDAARPEALPSTSELVAQAELSRELVAHVLALREPYRTAVLLRYFQGLDARQIARRQSVPLATVRTRLQRALALLRESLDRSHGGRASWCAALLVSADGGAASGGALGTMSSVSIGGGSVAIAWKAGTAVLLTVGAWWAWRILDGQGHPPPTASVPARAVADLAPAAQASDVEQVAESTDLDVREALAPGPAREAERAQAAPAAVGRRILGGRVVDDRGRPVGGLRLVADFGPPASQTASGRWTGTTLSDGSFAFEVEGVDVHVASADRAWILTCSGAPLGSSEQLWVAAPAIAVAGIVVDESGAPLAGASIVAGHSCSALEDFPFVLYGTDGRTWTTSSAADGTFHFESLPAFAGLVVALAGYDAVEVGDLEAFAQVVLRATRPPRTRALDGQVVDGLGQGVPGARVSFGPHATWSDARGRFALQVTDHDAATPLAATHAGYAPVVLERFGATVLERPEGVDGIVLRLDGAPRSIAGRVLDAQGRPARGWWIDLADGTPTGGAGGTLEVDAASAAGRSSPVLTDDEGRFRLEGLLDRPYRVRAFDASRCLYVESEPTAPGVEDLLLSEPQDALRPLVRGRVLSQRGRPVGGAVVRLTFVAARLPSGEELLANCREVQADAEGRFEFLDLAHRHLRLRVEGPHVESGQAFDIPASGELELRASVRCRFRADVRPDDPCDELRVLDGDGRALPITLQSADASALHAGVKRRGNSFPVCIVPEDAAALVLLREGVELRRLALDLLPDELRIVSVP